MRIIMMAGGTGGHVFPALAIAEALRDLGHHVSWLGTAHKLEAEVVPKAGFAIDFLSISGIRRNGLLKWAFLPILLSRAIWQAWRIIRRHKPDVIVGMGGYAAGPGGIAARLCRVPLIIHEQNAIAGLTNRLLSKIAQTKLAAFNRALGPDTHVIGNPLRADFYQYTQTRKVTFREHPLHLLIIGGSLGAKALNQVVPDALKKLTTDIEIDIHHQTGRATHVLAKQHYQGLKYRHKLSTFIEDIAAAYCWADLVICRSGALTVSELSVMGKPAIFVPLPHAVDDHQYLNAEPLVNNGAALCLRQCEFTADKLAQSLTALINQPQKLIDMSTNMLKQAKPNATQDFIKHISPAMPGTNNHHAKS